jgi:hypothetical protein
MQNNFSKEINKKRNQECKSIRFPELMFLILQIERVEITRDNVYLNSPQVSEDTSLNGMMELPYLSSLEL